MARNNIGALIFFGLVVLDGFLWYAIISAGSWRAGDYFLDVGQGDSELIVLPDGVKLLTDGGPDASVVSALARVLPYGDRYIDLAIISHPQADHYNGFNYLLDNWKVGAVLWNGRDDAPTVASWQALKAKIRAQHIPMVPVGRGDRIRVGEAVDDILSPDVAMVQSAELNDTGLIELVQTPDLRTLLTADIAFNVENFLLASGANLKADVLKVPHHGSKYSSGAEFLRAVSPTAAIIEVGANNTYGHPAKETLARIASSTNAEIFRTDKNGTVEIFAEEGKLKVRAGK
jgi:competence protein ComEC